MADMTSLENALYLVNTQGGPKKYLNNAIVIEIYF